MSKLNAYQKLSVIQQELKAPKNQYNSFGKYKYRSAEDILESIKPFEKKYGVTFMIDDTLRSFETLEKPMIYVNACAIMRDNDSGETIAVNAQAMVDFEAKGMQMPQRTGAASSYAKKYALGNLLLLDDTKDADAVNTHGHDAPAGIKKKATKKTPTAMTPSIRDRFLQAIKDGKFNSVEENLSKYAPGQYKVEITKALSKAKASA